MKKSIHAIAVSFILTLLFPAISNLPAQSYGKVPWEKMEITGRHFKIVESQKKFPTWIFIPAGAIGGGAIAYLIFQDEEEKDDVAPVIVCPDNVTIQCQEGFDPGQTGTASATDNKSAVTAIEITYSDDNTGLTGCNNTGTMVRTWRATDESGNVSTCIQQIRVEDTEAPVIDCPADITLNCNEGTDPAVTGTAQGTDNCTQASELNISFDDDANGLTGCNETGTLVRTWTGTDACGNSVSCTQTISVQDITEPVIDCPVDVTVNCDQGIDPAVTGMAQGTDNCTASTELSITFEDDASGLTGCNGTGILLRTWTATDECGNASFCLQTITIEDITPPVINCPVDITLVCGQSIDPVITGLPITTDACSIPDLTFTDDQSGVIGCEGVIERTWLATDDCGNVSVCIQQITIEPMGEMPEWPHRNNYRLVYPVNRGNGVEFLNLYQEISMPEQVWLQYQQPPELPWTTELTYPVLIPGNTAGLQYAACMTDHFEIRITALAGTYTAQSQTRLRNPSTGKEVVAVLHSYGASLVAEPAIQYRFNAPVPGIRPFVEVKGSWQHLFSGPDHYRMSEDITLHFKKEHAGQWLIPVSTGIQVPFLKKMGMEVGYQLNIDPGSDGWRISSSEYRILIMLF